VLKGPAGVPDQAGHAHAIYNASDKPHDPEAYAAEHNVGDVIAVLDRLGISKASYFGYSMGGLIGFGMALIWGLLVYADKLK